MAFADRARNITTRGNSIRTKPARRVPGSPAPYIPAPAHPVEDAVVPEDIIPYAPAPPEIPDTPADVPARELINFVAVLRHAHDHQIQCRVTVPADTYQGIPRQEFENFWSVLAAETARGGWRSFFFAHHIVAISLYEKKP